jgi:hypothetical protein
MNYADTVPNSKCMLHMLLHAPYKVGMVLSYQHLAPIGEEDDASYVRYQWPWWLETNGAHERGKRGNRALTSSVCEKIDDSSAKTNKVWWLPQQNRPKLQLLLRTGGDTYHHHTCAAKPTGGTTTAYPHITTIPLF